MQQKAGGMSEIIVPMQRSKRQQAKLNTLKDEVREYRALQEIAANPQLLNN